MTELLFRIILSSALLHFLNGEVMFRLVQCCGRDMAIKSNYFVGTNFMACFSLITLTDGIIYGLVIVE